MHNNFEITFSRNKEQTLIFSIITQIQLIFVSKNVFPVKLNQIKNNHNKVIKRS